MMFFRDSLIVSSSLRLFVSRQFLKLKESPGYQTFLALPIPDASLNIVCMGLRVFPGKAKLESSAVGHGAKDKFLNNIPPSVPQK